MNRLMNILIRLYPRAWRERYGEEFREHVGAAGSGWRDAWDVGRGGLAMRIHYAARSRWRRAAIAGGLAGLAMAAVAGWMIPDRYISTATVEADSQRVTSLLTRRALMGVLEKEHLYEPERARLPLEDLIERMRKATHIDAGRGPVVTVSFEHTDPGTAQRVAQAIAGLLEPLKYLDDAALPQTPAYPNRPVIFVVGLLTGLAAGLILRFLVALIRPPEPPPALA